MSAGTDMDFDLPSELVMLKETVSRFVN